MKKTLFSLVAVLFINMISIAQVSPQWIRYQSISPDGKTIAFTYKGNLYSVAASGGDAKQLTYHKAHDYMPVWSKDSKQLAFASDRYGNFDVFVMDALGGPATRLTFHSNDEHPYSFSADNKSVIFGAVRQDLAEHRQFPTGSQPELYKVPVSGGRVDQIFTIPAEYVQVSEDGKTLVYHDKPGGENEWRKHHVSSVTRDLWKYYVEEDKHTMITSFKGEDRQPIFDKSEENLYYLSEESGNFNIHKLSLANPEENVQLTDFTDFPVRFLSFGNGTLSFGYDGELYTMKEGESPKKVQVNIRTQSGDNSDNYININDGVEEMAIAPNGKEIAFIARGEVFVTSTDGSLTKRITNTPNRERFLSFAPDGKSVVYSSERDGIWNVYKTEIVRKEEPFFYASTLLKEETLIKNEDDSYLAEYSPDGKKLAYISGRRTLKVKDVATGKEIELLTPKDLFTMGDGDQYFTWSPDSKWLLVDWGKLLSNNEVLLLAADGSKRENLTESGYQDYEPKWANEGKQMIWFSNRNGLKSYATSGRTETDVYSMFFTQDAYDKFKMSEEDYKLMKAVEEALKEDKDEDEKDKNKSKKDKKKAEETKALEFDWDGLKERKERLTTHSSSLSDAVLSKDGEKIYYLSSFEDKNNLWETNLRTGETNMAVKLNSRGGSLVWDEKQENLYLLSGGNISKIDVEKEKSEGIKISGDMYYDEVAEREKMFDHVYIRTKNVFYEPTFHGKNWDSLYVQYKKYLPHIGNSYEFAEMLAEMLGELNVSHSGARYSNRSDEGDETASLGIFTDYDFKEDGIKITEVIKGGPLDKAAYDIKAGMIITAIDGEKIESDQDIAKYLNHKADKFVLLEFNDPEAKKPKQITMKPISLGEERNLLYNRFVRINRKEVEEKSGGKLGYVHIPGMSDEPYRSIYEDMMGKYFETKGVIVDTRFNGGGDLVADLAAFFTGTPFITYETEAKVVGGEPTSRWTKPTLSLFNESMYSDGHCYASGYTDLNIGTTVGMPVPGTCSFAGWERLADGTVWGVVPVSAKNKAGEWMENNQTEPDIIVKNMPGVISEGRDQQLEKGIEVLLDQVSEE
ncbi:S41 family peptidase [Zunongwangia endophytica]|uniref:Tricorn protease homolog n=1 Tax=Zunongwangia endophytica TaxID=1808945 RepID=A0ABV8H8K6_9FLAO|nr:S41 family peptidase [Zunongwangia endophytica]MDN3595344.1 S41 family peptidase [Zunongwangia endophytica]